MLSVGFSHHDLFVLCMWYVLYIFFCNSLKVMRSVFAVIPEVFFLYGTGKNLHVVL